MVGIFRFLLRIFPFQLRIKGRKRNIIMNTFDALFMRKMSNVMDGPRQLRLSKQNAGERLLIYAFWNVRRFYANSPLGQYMFKKLTPSDTFIDIGANLGMYSLLSKEIGSYTLAFEPEPVHGEYMKRNPQIYDKFYEVALSDRASKVPFYRGNLGNLGSSSLIPNEKNKEVVEVSADTFDNVDGVEALKNVSLIKIDVEGNEEFVLIGMKEFLKTNSPEIWCEVRGYSSKRNGGSCYRCIEFMEPYGYKPYVVLPNGRTVLFEPKYEERTFDILFVKE